MEWKRATNKLGKVVVEAAPRYVLYVFVCLTYFDLGLILSIAKREHNNSQEVRVQNSNVQDHGVRKRRSSRSPSSRHHRRPRERSVSPRSVLRQQILENSGREVEGTIVSLAHQVRNYGTKYEGMVREREVHNPSYAFLRDRNVSL